MSAQTSDLRPPRSGKGLEVTAQHAVRFREPVRVRPDDRLAAVENGALRIVRVMRKKFVALVPIGDSGMYGARSRTMRASLRLR